METKTNFVLTELPGDVVKSVDVKTDDGQLKYHFLINLLKKKVVLPSKHTNAILLEALEAHKEDSLFLKHLVGYAFESMMVIDEFNEIIEGLKGVIEDLASLVDEDTAEDILGDYGLGLDEFGELVWEDEDGYQDAFEGIEADDLLAEYDLSFEVEGDEALLFLGQI